MQYPEGPLGGMELGPAGEAQGVAPLLVRPVLTDEVVHWDRLMAAHHYLGVRRLVGESLRYVAEQGGQWVALLGWLDAGATVASAALCGEQPAFPSAARCAPAEPGLSGIGG